MKELIYTNNSLPPELCDDIIDHFYLEKKNLYEGQTMGGLNKTIKNTLDFSIPNNCSADSFWYKINKLLQKELYNNLTKYFATIENNLLSNSDNKYKVFNKFIFHENVFMIQKYEKQNGFYTYHHDGHVNKNEYRVITYLWYLNDVDYGGETEVWHTLKIKPEKGKLLFFPAHFSIPHCGLMPISSNKYIITGWLYQNI